MNETLIFGECLEQMALLPDASIDAIITDPPYGTTACKWDSVIPFVPMWAQLKRIIKPRGAIVLFGSQPFTSALIMSNVKWFKYCWVWDKRIPSGMSYAKYQPMRQHEDVLTFGERTVKYYPQHTKRYKPIKGGGMVQSASAATIGYKPLKKSYSHANPTTIISYMKIRTDAIHPTQKPVKLMEYLIKTYTLEGETVLDFTMGSGSTGVACKNTGRDFIGIEQDQGYYEIAQKRIAAAVRQLELGL